MGIMDSWGAKILLSVDTLSSAQIKGLICGIQMKTPGCPATPPLPGFLHGFRAGKRRGGGVCSARHVTGFRPGIEGWGGLLHLRFTHTLLRDLRQDPDFGAGSEGGVAFAMGGVC